MQSLVQKYSRYIGFVITLLIVWLLVSWFKDIVTWVVLAWIISLLGSPVMKLLGRIKIKKWELPSSVRALFVLAFFYGVFGLFLYLFVPVSPTSSRAGKRSSKNTFKPVRRSCAGCAPFPVRD